MTRIMILTPRHYQTGPLTIRTILLDNDHFTILMTDNANHYGHDIQDSQDDTCDATTPSEHFMTLAQPRHCDQNDHFTTLTPPQCNQQRPLHDAHY
ncbi:hypothetical protein P692DRAFT_2030383 [Suillus brevipes Sb2]|nr:hypothetical protein P692DRAFT_2030383 [Suillus brevipes Sb2]